MFDLSVYAGPALVVAGMLVAFVGFCVCGGRAIRESAEDAVAAEKVARKSVARLAPEVDDKPDVDNGVDPLLDSAVNLERTAEFVQPAFAQTFKPETVEVDFDAAIDRITADLAAAEAAAEDAESGAWSDTVPGLTAVDEDIEATRMLKADDRAAILQEEVAEAMVVENAENVEQNVEQVEAAELSPEQMEQTIVMPKLAEESAVQADDAEMLDKLALEETRLISQEIADETTDNAEPAAPVFGEGAEETARPESLFPEAPVPFGPKMAWLAIPGYTASEVISALRLGDVAPANWTKGLGLAYSDNNQVFVTPALSGWVLVIGKTLWQKADMNCSAENIQWLKDVGRLFGNACFFSTMRGLGNHGWVGIRNGNIVRAYGYSGELQELIWLVGDPTEEEIAVNPAFANEVEERMQPGFRPVIPDEKMVLAMAAGWSVDVSFRNRRYMRDYGFVGTLE